MNNIIYSNLSALPLDFQLKIPKLQPNEDIQIFNCIIKKIFPKNFEKIINNKSSWCAMAKSRNTLLTCTYLLHQKNNPDQINAQNIAHILATLNIKNSICNHATINADISFWHTYQQKIINQIDCSIIETQKTDDVKDNNPNPLTKEAHSTTSLNNQTTQPSKQTTDNQYPIISTKNSRKEINFYHLSALFFNNLFQKYKEKTFEPLFNNPDIVNDFIQSFVHEIQQTSSNKEQQTSALILANIDEQKVFNEKKALILAFMLNKQHHHSLFECANDLKKKFHLSLNIDSKELQSCKIFNFSSNPQYIKEVSLFDLWHIQWFNNWRKKRSVPSGPRNLIDSYYHATDKDLKTFKLNNTPTLASITSHSHSTPSKSATIDNQIDAAHDLNSNQSLFNGGFSYSTVNIPKKEDMQKILNLFITDYFCINPILFKNLCAQNYLQLIKILENEFSSQSYESNFKNSNIFQNLVNQAKHTTISTEIGSNKLFNPTGLMGRAQLEGLPNQLRSKLEGTALSSNLNNDEQIKNFKAIFQQQEIAAFWLHSLYIKDGWFVHLPTDEHHKDLCALKPFLTNNILAYYNNKSNSKNILDIATPTKQIPTTTEQKKLFEKISTTKHGALKDSLKSPWGIGYVKNLSDLTNLSYGFSKFKCSTNLNIKKIIDETTLILKYEFYNSNVETKNNSINSAAIELKITPQQNEDINHSTQKDQHTTTSEKTVSYNLFDEFVSSNYTTDYETLSITIGPATIFTLLDALGAPFAKQSLQECFNENWIFHYEIAKTLLGSLNNAQHWCFICKLIDREYYTEPHFFSKSTNNGNHWKLNEQHYQWIMNWCYNKLITSIDNIDSIFNNNLSLSDPKTQLTIQNSTTYKRTDNSLNTKFWCAIDPNWFDTKINKNEYSILNAQHHSKDASNSNHMVSQDAKTTDTNPEDNLAYVKKYSLSTHIIEKHQKELFKLMHPKLLNTWLNSSVNAITLVNLSNSTAAQLNLQRQIKNIISTKSRENKFHNQPEALITNNNQNLAKPNLLKQIIQKQKDQEQENYDTIIEKEKTQKIITAEMLLTELFESFNSFHKQQSTKKNAPLFKHSFEPTNSEGTTAEKQWQQILNTIIFQTFETTYLEIQEMTGINLLDYDLPFISASHMALKNYKNFYLQNTIETKAHSLNHKNWDTINFNSNGSKMVNIFAEPIDIQLRFESQKIKQNPTDLDERTKTKYTFLEGLFKQIDSIQNAKNIISKNINVAPTCSSKIVTSQSQDSNSSVLQKNTTENTFSNFNHKLVPDLFLKQQNHSQTDTLFKSDAAPISIEQGAFLIAFCKELCLAQIFSNKTQSISKWIDTLNSIPNTLFYEEISIKNWHFFLSLNLDPQSIFKSSKHFSQNNKLPVSNSSTSYDKVDFKSIYTQPDRKYSWQQILECTLTFDNKNKSIPNSENSNKCISDSGFFTTLYASCIEISSIIALSEHHKKITTLQNTLKSFIDKKTSNEINNEQISESKKNIYELFVFKTLDTHVKDFLPKILLAPNISLNATSHQEHADEHFFNDISELPNTNKLHFWWTHFLKFAQITANLPEKTIYKIFKTTTSTSKETHNSQNQNTISQCETNSCTSWSKCDTNRDPTINPEGLNSLFGWSYPHNSSESSGTNDFNSGASTNDSPALSSEPTELNSTEIIKSIKRPEFSSDLRKIFYQKNATNNVIAYPCALTIYSFLLPNKKNNLEYSIQGVLKYKNESNNFLDNCSSILCSQIEAHLIKKTISEKSKKEDYVIKNWRNRL